MRFFFPGAMEQRRAATLWMGDIEPYMDDNFLYHAFKEALGRSDNVVREIKFPLNRLTGMPAGYCFVEFIDPNLAKMALHKLGGKTIPNTHPMKRFKLNTTGDKLTEKPSWSVWVGDLDPSVDEEILYNYFSRHYPSVLSVKIVCDRLTQQSRGFAFVRFGDQTEQQKSMIELNNTELHGKLIKIRTAQPKDKPTTTSSTTPTQSTTMQYPDMTAYQQMMYSSSWYQPVYYHMRSYSEYDEDPEAVIDQVLVDDSEQINRDFVNMSSEVYNSLEESRWFGMMHPLKLEDLQTD